MSLGLRLQLAREKLGLTEEEVAKAANMRARYYTSIEDDEVPNPTPLTLGKLADVLSVNLDYLLGNEELASDLSDVLSTPYLKVVNLTMKLVIVLGVLTLIASCAAFATVSVRAISSMIPDKLSQNPSQDYQPLPMPTSTSTPAYIGNPILLHPQSPGDCPEDTICLSPGKTLPLLGARPREF